MVSEMLQSYKQNIFEDKSEIQVVSLPSISKTAMQEIKSRFKIRTDQIEHCGVDSSQDEEEK